MLQPKQGPFRLMKKASTIQYGYRKYGTGKSVLETRVHGNSKNEIRQRKSQWPNYCLGLTSPQGHYSPKQWMNYLKNITLTYNPSPFHRRIVIKNLQTYFI